MAFVVLMTDPAVALVEGYEPYDRGTNMDVWLKLPDGTISIGLVWPGMSNCSNITFPAAYSYLLLGVTVYPGMPWLCSLTRETNTL